ncbi:hypothetical protein [Paracoccus sp. MKU1]|uniref:hypothetical protein n=1 Tax=Paracoccus sp. MKU1 TaxID=1745182 RepID=UPI00128EDB5F|nr:hypothetical protein [Paracoccus sp. MKU1]
MLENLRRRLAELGDSVGQATDLRYGSAAFISDLPQRLEQDLPAPPHNGPPPHSRAETLSIGRLVRHLDGG